MFPPQKKKTLRTSERHTRVRFGACKMTSLMFRKLPDPAQFSRAKIWPKACDMNTIRFNLLLVDEGPLFTAINWRIRFCTRVVDYEAVDSEESVRCGSAWHRSTSVANTVYTCGALSKEPYRSTVHCTAHRCITGKLKRLESKV